MTLRDGLDLFATLEDMTVSMRNTKVYRKEYVDNLRHALEAALVVIEASMILENAETVTEIQVADVRCRSAEKALNIALAPFRKNQNA